MMGVQMQSTSESVVIAANPEIAGGGRPAVGQNGEHRTDAHDIALVVYKSIAQKYRAEDKGAKGHRAQGVLLDVEISQAGEKRGVKKRLMSLKSLGVVELFSVFRTKMGSGGARFFLERFQIVGILKLLLILFCDEIRGFRGS